MNNNQFWTQRYKLQAQWTKEIRKLITQQISLSKQSKVLEIGCGSLAVLEEFVNQDIQLFGVDIDYSILNYHSKSDISALRINADGYYLPFDDSYFDLCYCHYLLLWLNSPMKVLQEMKRVTKNSGWLCCFAEPDYLGRIDFPTSLETLGKFQNQSLEKQGVNLSSGRNLAGWFSQLELSNITWGILGSHNPLQKQGFNQDEWKITEIDISEDLTPSEISKFQEMDFSAQKDGSRIFFVPTFYAYAKIDK